LNLESAENALAEWTVAANALALLRAAHTSGAFARLCELTPIEELASDLRLNLQQTRQVCMALEALGVANRDGNAYRLTEGWATMMAADRPTSLGDRLELTRLLATAIDSCFDDPLGFAAVSPEEAVGLARSVWGVPGSPDALKSWTDLDAQMPEVRAVWQAGGRHAEFGCGAGRDLLRVVAMYPGVTAVGYELLPHVAEHARQLAAALDIEDRVEFRIEDVQTAAASAEFDTMVWSQIFFPPEVRPATIASIKRAIKPDGLLIMPLMADLPEPDAVPPTAAGRAQLLIAVAYRRWALYWPSASDVQREMERAGFEHLYTIPHPRTPFVVVRLPT
jgi:SAM-dependent methyltransferase